VLDIDLLWSAHQCCLGHHNEGILRGVLGLSDAEIDELQREQIIGKVPAALLPK
jgi:hypothetical protein